MKKILFLFVFLLMAPLQIRANPNFFNIRTSKPKIGDVITIKLAQILKMPFSVSLGYDFENGKHAKFRIKIRVPIGGG